GAAARRRVAAHAHRLPGLAAGGPVGHVPVVPEPARERPHHGPGRELPGDARGHRRPAVMRLRSLAASAALAVVAMVAAAGLAAPAHAIETAEFGVAPTDGRQHLKEEVRPGRTTTDSVRVWNKTDHPVSVRLSVVGASLDGTGAGSVRLGGTGGAMSWVRISQPAIDLAPHAGQIVSFSVHAPRELPPGTSTAALV